MRRRYLLPATVHDDSHTERQAYRRHIADELRLAGDSWAERGFGFADVVGVRLLIGSLVGSVIAAIGIVIVVVIRLFTNQAIPGWAAYTAGTLSIILIQLVTIATCFTFFMLSARTAMAFVPRRDADCLSMRL